MGKAFVAKLAKEGARDPEALAAWIGRKKHGAKAFGKLATAGRKKGHGDSDKGGNGASSSPSTPRPAAKKTTAPSGGGISEARLEAGRRQARAMSDRQLQGIKQGLVGKRDDLARAQRQVINDEIKRRREQEKADRATAKQRAEESRARTREAIRRADEEHARQEAEVRERREQYEAQQRAEREAKQQARAARQQKLTDSAQASDRSIAAAERAAAAKAKDKSADTLRDEAKAATDAIAAFNRRDTVRNGKPGYIGPGSPEYDQEQGAQLNERAAAAYRVAAEAESDPDMRQTLEFAASQHAAAAQRHRAYAAGALQHEPEQFGDLTIMDALTQASRAVRSVANSVQDAEIGRARRETAAREREEREAARAETLHQINASFTGRSLRRKALSKEERELVNATATQLSVNTGAYERARAYEDESAQTNRVDVLRSRAFHRAREQRRNFGLPV